MPLGFRRDREASDNVCKRPKVPRSWVFPAGALFKPWRPCHQTKAFFSRIVVTRRPLVQLELPTLAIPFPSAPAVIPDKRATASRQAFSDFALYSGCMVVTTVFARSARPPSILTPCRRRTRTGRNRRPRRGRSKCPPPRNSGTSRCRARARPRNGRVRWPRARQSAASPHSERIQPTSIGHIETCSE